MGRCFVGRCSVKGSCKVIDRFDEQKHVLFLLRGALTATVKTTIDVHLPNNTFEYSSHHVSQSSSSHPCSFYSVQAVVVACVYSYCHLGTVFPCSGMQAVGAACETEDLGTLFHHLGTLFHHLGTLFHHLSTRPSSTQAVEVVCACKLFTWGAHFAAY